MFLAFPEVTLQDLIYWPSYLFTMTGNGSLIRECTQILTVSDKWVKILSLFDRPM